MEEFSPETEVNKSIQQKSFYGEEKTTKVEANFEDNSEEVTQFDPRSKVSDVQFKSVVDTSDLQKSIESINKENMKSPEFGPVCQMKRKEIMAQAEPIEMHQMSNFKSPCVCEDCTEKRV